MNIKDLIKDNSVYFLHYKDGDLWYYIKYKTGTEMFASLGYGEEERAVYKTYKFPVSISETKGGTFPASDKAIFFMRFIKQAMDNNLLTEI